MKKLLPAALFLALLAMTACDNELDLAADWKDVSVVYGKLSISDTAQYIRIERAFLDDKQSALSFTKNPDSIYYANASVRLVRLSDGSTYELTRVDANAEGYVRDTGIWAQSPNYVYKIRTADLPLVAGEEYELVIDKGPDFPVSKSQTTVVGAPEIIFSTDPPKMGLSYNAPYKVAYHDGGNGVLYDLDLFFHYEENSADQPNVFTPHTIRWKVLKGAQPEAAQGNIKRVSFEGIEFYRWLRDNLTADPLIKRKFLSIDLMLTAGGKELKEYTDIERANFGITGSEVQFTYSNIENGVGIFTSTAMDSVSNIQLSAPALDLLKNGDITQPLGFIQ